MANTTPKNQAKSDVSLHAQIAYIERIQYWFQETSDKDILAEIKQSLQRLEKQDKSNPALTAMKTQNSIAFWERTRLRKSIDFSSP